MNKLSKLVLDDGKSKLTFSSLLWSKLKGKIRPGYYYEVKQALSKIEKKYNLVEKEK